MPRKNSTVPASRSAAAEGYGVRARAAEVQDRAAAAAASQRRDRVLHPTLLLFDRIPCNVSGCHRFLSTIGGLFLLMYRHGRAGDRDPPSLGPSTLRISAVPKPTVPSGENRPNSSHDSGWWDGRRTSKMPIALHITTLVFSLTTL